MVENLDDVVEEGDKTEYVDLKDLNKARRKKEMSDKYQSFKAKIGSAVSKGKEFLSKSKEVTGKAYEASKKGASKAVEGYKKFSEKAQKFDKWIKGNRKQGKPISYAADAKRRKAIMKSARQQQYVTPQATDTFGSGIGLTPSNQSENIFGSGFGSRQSKQAPSNDFGMGNIFNSPKPSKSRKQAPSDDFGMGSIFGSSSQKKSKKKGNNPFDML